MRYNQIVARHPRMCHHCGFHGTVVETCTGCGIQAHEGCYKMTDGKCDMCTHAIDDAVCCALCLQADLEYADKDSTKRLSKSFVHYGRTWSRDYNFTPDAIGEDYLILKADGAYAHVVTKLGEDPKSTFLPNELPQLGSVKMVATVAADEVYVSDPLVVHSWCKTAMQIEDVPAALECKHKYEKGYDPTTFDKDDPEKQRKATWETHACNFCDEKKGYAIFCHYHVTHKAGCRNCGCNTAFHPSCAVRQGFQRYVHKGMCGVACLHNTVTRKSLAPKHSGMLATLSGINTNFDTDAWNLDLEDVPRMGAVPPKKKKARNATDEDASPKKKKARNATDKDVPPKKKKARNATDEDAPQVEDVEEIVAHAAQDGMTMEDVEEIVAREVDAIRDELRAEMDAKLQALRNEIRSEDVEVDTELVD